MWRLFEKVQRHHASGSRNTASGHRGSQSNLGSEKKKLTAKTRAEEVVKLLAKIICGPFEVISSKMPPKRTKDEAQTKIFYLKLSNKLDQYQVLDKINSSSYGKKFKAFIPNKSDIPAKTVGKKGKIPLKLRLRHHIPVEETPEQVLLVTHVEMLAELQYKYTGLLYLSKKTNHQLMDSIAETIADRLKKAMELYPDATESGFKLSRAYRKMHPHFGDFQMILSSLHSIQDALGQPREQIVEADLCEPINDVYTIDNLPFSKVQSACNRYSDKIVKKVLEHVKNYNVAIKPEDSEEEKARKTIRKEIKSISTYLPMIIKQVTERHFVPEKKPFTKCRIYGEPALPAREAMDPILKRFKAVKIMRSDRMYNVLRFKVAPQVFGELVRSFDGTVVENNKLVVRDSEIPLYKVARPLIAQMLGDQMMNDELIAKMMEEPEELDDDYGDDDVEQNDEGMVVDQVGECD